MLAKYFFRNNMNTKSHPKIIVVMILLMLVGITLSPSSFGFTIETNISFKPYGSNTLYVTNCTLKLSRFEINETIVFLDNNILDIISDRGDLLVKFEKYNFPCEFCYSIAPSNPVSSVDNTIGGFIPDTNYTLYVDENYYALCTSNSEGVINFSYSSGGNHTFCIFSMSPIISNENPSDRSSDLPLNPLLSINVSDIQGDEMDIIFRSNTSGIWQNIGFNNSVNNGTYTQKPYFMDNYSTTYYWSVNATDPNGTGKWTNKTFRFTTMSIPAVWWNTNWLYRKEIIIDHNKVDSDLVNFPLLINIFDSDVKNYSSPNGYDIVFTDYSGIKLNHEIELYDNDNGHLIAWVNISSLTSTSDTIIYMYYGNYNYSNNQQNVTGTWSSDYIMVQHFSETSETLYDSTIYSNDGTSYGAIYISSAMIDGGYDFDGIDDYIDFGSNPSLDITDEITIEAWLYARSFAEQPDIITKGDYAEAYSIWLNSEGKLLFAFNNNHFDSNSDLSSYSWYYIAVTKEGSCKIFINGEEDISYEFGDDIETTVNPLKISNSDWPFNGIIDEVRISNNAKSSAWISTTYSNLYSPGTFVTIGGQEVRNQPPKIPDRPLGPTTGNPNEFLNFSTSTIDPDNDFIYYRWNWECEVSEWLGPFSSGETCNVSHVWMETGSYEVKVKAKDSNGEESNWSNPLTVYVGLDVNQSLFDRGFPIRHALDGDWAAAQNYIPTVNTITRVEISMRKFGTPEFNLTVDLREDHPQGTLLDTKVFTPDEIPSSWEWFTVDFEDTTITPDTSYFIVCPPAPVGITSSFGYEWGYAFGNQYDDGAFWFTRDGGGLWRDLPTMYEFCFRTYGYN
jgi:hypothetical protein